MRYTLHIYSSFSYFVFILMTSSRKRRWKKWNYC